MRFAVANSGYLPAYVSKRALERKVAAAPSSTSTCRREVSTEITLGLSARRDGDNVMHLHQPEGLRHAGDAARCDPEPSRPTTIYGTLRLQRNRSWVPCGDPMSRPAAMALMTARAARRPADAPGIDDRTRPVQLGRAGRLRVNRRSARCARLDAQPGERIALFAGNRRGVFD